MKEPGRIALKAVDLAAANVGVTEDGGENRGKAVETYLRSVNLPPGSPWCAAHAYYRESSAAWQLGLQLPADFPRSGWCPDFEAWGKKNGLWIPVRDAVGVVRPGDMALFWFAAKGRVAHAGLVEQARPWGVVTIEGNTGPDSGDGVQREGDGIYRKTRKWGAFGLKGGFVRLPF